MQKQFKREQRYFVVKVKDAKEYLDAHQLEKLAEIADTISEGREKDGIPAVECIVVESDWPEYESTWRAIEDRVTGAQPAPSFADAYQGAMEEVAIWKRRALEAEDLNRKFVAEINGPAYMGEPAQPAPALKSENVSFIDTSQLEGLVSTEIVHSYPPPSGWLRAIDEALIVTHLGVANAEDSYEDAKRKLDALIGWHCDVVTDPAVNGGWKLVPVEILDRFPEINQNNYNHDDVCNLNAWGVELVLAAAPEAKP